MKGIILAGGLNSRLFPVTQAICKQLLPVYDKPMIYYPLSILMLAHIREILIISTPRDTSRIADLLGDGRQLGLELTYRVQEEPRGIADAFVLGRDFIAGDSCALILGDNILYGHNLYELLHNAQSRTSGATVFGYEVPDPESFGILEIGPDGRAISIEEKPKRPKSHWAVIGLYFYDDKVSDIAAALEPSGRGELEITDINNHYLQRGELYVERLYRGFAWLDCGNAEALQEASQFVHTMQKRQRYKIACIEEIAYRLGYIEDEDLERLATPIAKSEYGQYLMEISHEVGDREVRYPRSMAQSRAGAARGGPPAS